MSNITPKERNRSIKLGIISAILIMISLFIPLLFRDFSLTLGYFISLTMAYFSFFILLEMS